MVARITFRSEIYIEGDSMEEIKDKWNGMPLYSKQAEKADIDFVEVNSVEDADTYEDLMSEFNNAY